MDAPELGHVIPNENQNIFKIEGNGIIDGNVIVLAKVKPRYETHYMRISAPVSKYDENCDELLGELTKFNGEKLIIAPGGAVYYDNHDDIAIVCELFSPLVFLNRSKDYSPSLKFLTAYLKSSVAVWYAERCLGSYDIRKSLIKNLPVPGSVDSVNMGRAENLVDDLIKLEHEFLTAENILLQEVQSLEHSEIQKVVELSKSLSHNHNIKACELMSKIDELFYEFYDFSSKEINIIEQVIKSSGFATFTEKRMDD